MIDALQQIAESARFEASAEVEFGFDGKTLIHPSQLDRHACCARKKKIRSPRVIAAFELRERRPKADKGRWRGGGSCCTWKAKRS